MDGGGGYRVRVAAAVTAEWFAATSVAVVAGVLLGLLPLAVMMGSVTLITSFVFS